QCAVVPNLEDWNPISSRCLHGYAGDPEFLEPIGQRVQISSAGAETANVLGRRLCRHAGKVLFSTDVNAGGLGIDRLPALINGYFLLFLFGFWSFAFHVRVIVVSAQEWHEKLQSLKQDSSAGLPEPAELR